MYSVQDGRFLLAGLSPFEIGCAETVLKGLGTIEIVHDAAGLLRALAGGRRPSLIVMDVERPALEPAATLRRIWEDPLNRDIPVIQAVSGPDSAVESPCAPPAWACLLDKPVRGKPLIEKGWVLMKLADYRREARERGESLEGARRELERAALRNARLEGEVARLEAALSRRGGGEGGDSAGAGACGAAAGGADRIARLQGTLLSAVTSLVEFRDDVTGGHVTRTMRWLEILLEGLDAEGIYARETRGWDRETLLQSSKLHDVGKIAISDAILKKPARLTPEEFEEMKAHAAIGGEIIDSIRAGLPASGAAFMGHARLLAVGHHEKWDGTGYPAGLAGEAIPLQGRLMAVSDVYDALVSRRPYKEPMSHAEASGIIVRGAGTHFDPAIAGVFSRLSGEFAASLRRLTG
ncbi:MAG: HD domain-containing protein [Deltaproteobacteria bacterium]|jgi:response regulator RpfG family c-di-GMP phosphodiesterase|nr:HD domain-containing protein [Deltaproteobacteria bacterium]